MLSEVLPSIGTYSLEQKIPLRHWQCYRWVADQQFTIATNLIGFGIDFDIQNRAVVDHVLLANAAARILHGNHLLGRAQTIAQSTS